MGKHFSHLTPTQRADRRLQARRHEGRGHRQEVGVHYTTIYRELKRCTYEHLNSDYTTEIRYNPDGAQARYEANLRAKGPELKIGNDYELADYLIGKIRDGSTAPRQPSERPRSWAGPSGCTSAQVRPTTTSGRDLRRRSHCGNVTAAREAPQEAGAARGRHPEKAGRKEHRKAAGDRDTRTTFGHWEMDSLEAARATSGRGSC